MAFILDMKMSCTTICCCWENTQGCVQPETRTHRHTHTHAELFHVSFLVRPGFQPFYIMQKYHEIFKKRKWRLMCSTVSVYPTGQRAAMAAPSTWPRSGERGFPSCTDVKVEKQSTHKPQSPPPPEIMMDGWMHKSIHE